MPASSHVAHRSYTCTHMDQGVWSKVVMLKLVICDFFLPQVVISYQDELEHECDLIPQFLSYFLNIFLYSKFTKAFLDWWSCGMKMYGIPNETTNFLLKKQDTASHFSCTCPVTDVIS